MLSTSRSRPWQLFLISCFLLPNFYSFVSSQRSWSGRPSPCDQWDVCSQKCQENAGGTNVTCACLEQFRLGADNRSCIANDPSLKIVYALKNSIKVWTVNRTSSISIVENKGQTVGVTVDVANGLVYWTDAVQGKEAVHRAKVNGQGPVETIIDTGLLLPEGIAFDWVTGNIYIADSNRSQIIVCRGDGKICAVLVRETSMDKPREIALHPAEGLMFWTDWGEKPCIMRASMDGSKRLAIIEEDVKMPNSLAVDHGRNRLYWTDAHHDKIETVTLDGGDRSVVTLDNVQHPFSLKVFGDMIFWSDWELMTIQTCTKFACPSDTRTVINSTHRPNGLAVFHPAAQPPVPKNNCQNKCTHICLLSGKSGFTCKCPAGYKLDSTKQICKDDDSKAKILIGHDHFVKVLRFDSIGLDVDIVEEINIPRLKQIGAMIYNPVNDSVFVSDLKLKGIFEYSFTSRRLEALTTRHLDSVKSLSLDVVGENLYWVDSIRHKIEVLSCRTGAKAVIATETDRPQSIVVIPEERYLFVGLVGQRGGRILRFNMNGYGRRTLVRTKGGEPISLTYNAQVNKIFWIDMEADTIQQMSLNGRSQVTVQRSGNPYGLTSFGTRIFWTDRFRQLLHSMAVFGLETKEAPLFVGHDDDKHSNGTWESYIWGNFHAGLSIMHKDTSVYDNLTQWHDCSTHHSAQSRKCSHICLISEKVNVGTCVCPEGMQLNDDGATCSWTKTCLATQFQCNDKHCIDSDWVCDSVADCAGGEDEANCQGVMASHCSPATEFWCEISQRCIHLNWRCDGEVDCASGEDEQNCVNGTNTHSCSLDTDFQCNDGRCIPISWRCDNRKECANGEDEIGCKNACPVGTFQCKKSLTLECISVDWLCDGIKDCGDGSDEELCEVEPRNTSSKPPSKKSGSSKAKVDRIQEDSAQKIQAIPEEASSRGSSSVGWWIFGIFVVLFMVGGAVGYVFHRKRLHPKILFERYARHIPVKFNIRRGVSRDGGDEETYQDFSDARGASSDNAGLLSNMDHI